MHLDRMAQSSPVNSSAPRTSPPLVHPVTDTSALPRKLWDSHKPKHCLKIVTDDDFTLSIDMTNAELADMMEMVWLAHEYGGDEDNEEQTLADLRRVMADRKARQGGVE